MLADCIGGLVAFDVLSVESLGVTKLFTFGCPLGLVLQARQAMGTTSSRIILHQTIHAYRYAKIAHAF